jgi:Phage head-tail joining protein
MPTAGDLRYRVGFYTRDSGAGSPDVPDYGSGDEYPTTATFTVWANIAPRLGGEAILANRLTGKNFVNITVRQSTNTNLVDPDWICKDEGTGEIYNIRSVIDPHQGDPDHGLWWEMLAEEGVAV